jgi:hypothetical protein
MPPQLAAGSYITPRQTFCSKVKHEEAVMTDSMLIKDLPVIRSRRRGEAGILRLVEVYV